ncbi:helix-turn-helix domain-containing protein [Candidatus Margulisiibacteriota bacterium]
MSWENIGYKEFPFKTEPIKLDTLDLFIGHDKEKEICLNVLNDQNVRLIVEGSRGVGTTSFANYLRFSKLIETKLFTPNEEISVEPTWNTEMLFTAIISSIIKRLEFKFGNKVANKNVFKEAKALSHRLSESYRSFGVNAFSFGANLNQSVVTTMPSIIPSNVLWDHLEALGELATELGFKNGILIQLNNLDINTVHTEEHLKYLFNSLRDYFQKKYFSWILVGDIGLKSFIARKVDRLDDIVSYNVLINPLKMTEYKKVIKKRISFFQLYNNALNPFEDDVYEYLFNITNGRLRYIFGLLLLLSQKMQLSSSIIQSVDFKLAQDSLKILMKDRVQHHQLGGVEELILNFLVKNENSNVTNIANALKKGRTQISRSLTSLLEKDLVSVIQEGTTRIYSPAIEPKIIYSN